MAGGFPEPAKKLGWNRRTAYNRKDKAAQEVAIALNNKAVPLPQADIDVVAQIAANNMHITATTRNRARRPKAWIADGAKPQMFVPEPAD